MLGRRGVKGGVADSIDGGFTEGSSLGPHNGHGDIAEVLLVAQRAMPLQSVCVVPRNSAPTASLSKAQEDRIASVITIESPAWSLDSSFQVVLSSRRGESFLTQGGSIYRSRTNVRVLKQT